jgi:hypothetical protein
MSDISAPRRVGSSWAIGVAISISIFASLWLGVGSAAAVPPSLGIEGSGAGEISGEPAGVAVNQETGEVYIADRNNSRIDKFGLEGEFLLAWGWAVADGKTEALQTCTTTCFGGFERAPFAGPGAGQFSRAEGIAVDNDVLSASHGDVYVVDSGNRRIEKFGPQGEFLLMFGGEVNAGTKGNVCLVGEECQAGVAGAGAGEFQALAGRAIAVDSAGTVYVSDENRVQMFSPAGAVEGEISIPGAGRIENLAVDSAKDIYLVGTELAGVHKYDGTGTELGSPRDEAGENEALAITIGPSDELFVNDFREERHHLFTFDAAGEQTASFDVGTRAQDGRRGIGYGEIAKSVYVLNPGTARIVATPPPGPLVLEGSELATDIEPTSATLHATINPEGPEATECQFEYGTDTEYGETTVGSELTGGTFEDQQISTPITGLSPGTTYHFRVSCENAAKETATGADQTFTTLPPISIDQTSASQINATSARLEAELNPHGVASEYRFEYGTSSAYGQTVPIPDGNVGSGTTDTTVSNLLQELLPSTTYHYRVVVHNTLGTVVGPDQTFITQGPASLLADGRTWELVSPPNKHGSPLEPLTEEGGLIQAAAGGGAFAYVSLGPVNGDPKGVRSPHDTQLLATRGPAGWSTQDITTPHEEVSIIRPGFPSEYQFFSEDLSASVVEPQGATPLSPETTERTPYRREANGEFTPLVTTGNVLPGAKFGGAETPEGTGEFSGGVSFLMASQDLRHVVLISPQLLTPDFQPGFEVNEEHNNLYEYSEGSLTLVSVLPNGEPASEAGLPAGLGFNNLNMRGAVSDDGGRVAFETSSAAHLFVRDIELGQAVQADEVQPGAAGGSGEAEFQAAGSTMSRIYFTDTSRLTVGSMAKPGKPDLYMCTVTVTAGNLGCTLTDLTVAQNLGEAADVRGKLAAIDASGDHVYFAANGVLTTAPNSRGEVAMPGNCEATGGVEGSCNLYEHDAATNHTRLVARLSSGDSPDWAGHGNLHVLGNLTSRTSPDGRYLAFMSERSLTGYDNNDIRSGVPDEEVFLYDSQSDKISCVSCNPTGGRPEGVFDKGEFPGLLIDHPNSWPSRWLAASVPGWTLQSLVVALRQPRYLSNSGRVFFNAIDALAPQDTNTVADVYEFEPPGAGDCTSTDRSYSSTADGCVSLVSSGSSKEESTLLDASESGDEAFFLTSSRLLDSDVDTALDVYDAHICSASSPCPPPPPPPAPTCEGDSCQNPSSPPSNSTPSSLTYRGPENPPPPSPAPPPKPKAKAKPTRAQLLAKALKACKKKKPKSRRASCEKQARKKYGPRKQGNSKHKTKGKNASQKGKGRR